jgi:tRNA nucleotidyltransferase (CCA-adding enzyme)
LAERPKPVLTGKFLLGLGMKPGREMGKLIAESFEMQLEGELADPEAAQEWARARLLE